LGFRQASVIILRFNPSFNFWVNHVLLTFIDRQTNLLARAQTFSSYKHHNTVIKVLIGIYYTPQGTTCFVSEAWGGRTSDKFRTENCGFLDNLIPGDLVLADRGFTVHESVPFHQAKLNIPAFTKGKDKLDSADVEQTRKIATVRIHVERIIGLLRQKYTILQQTFPTDFLICGKGESVPLINRMIRVCSALVHLCPHTIYLLIELSILQHYVFTKKQKHILSTFENLVV
jgi:hypothetical protein